MRLVTVWFAVTQYGNAACATEAEAEDIATIFRNRNEPVTITSLTVTPRAAREVLANA